MKACFLPADILLPAPGVDLEKWAVIACDQFTSQRAYWMEAASLVGTSPSTLSMICPEAWLNTGKVQIPEIHRAMREALSSGVLQEWVKDGFVLVRRTTPSGERLGLVGKLDLEQYDFTPGTSAPVRATEGTILARIPPRLQIREGAPLESPHIMMLVDDPGMQLIEPLAGEDLPELYDVELMLGGGHLSGYAVEGERAAQIAQKIETMQAASGGFFLTAGDGNHSLATAKTHWENLKKTLPPDEQENHPARYALCELVNLHSPALVFQPIHRVVFGEDGKKLLKGFRAFVKAQGMGLLEGEEIVFCQKNWRCGVSIAGRGDRLPIDLLQHFLDDKQVTLDYVHGERDALGFSQSAVALLLCAMDKPDLFPAVAAGGVLPRKTFSMGENREKRYYMEMRSLLKPCP